MPLIVTGFYASLTGLLIIALAYRVVKLRRSQKIGLGDGGNNALALANRVHANLIENAPIVLILMLVAEAGGLAHFYLFWYCMDCGAFTPCYWLNSRQRRLSSWAFLGGVAHLVGDYQPSPSQLSAFCPKSVTAEIG